MKKITALVIALCLVLVLVGCGGGEKPEHSATAADVMMQQFVLEKLKSPGSAEFASVYDTKSEYAGDNVYIVKSYVDSQNSFGAKIRTNYIGKIKYVGEDKWELVELHFTK